MSTKNPKNERDPEFRRALADHSFIYLKECALRFASADPEIHEDGRARIEAVCNLIGEHLDLQLWNQTLAAVNKENASGGRRLSEQQERRLYDRYLERCRNGEKYGAHKELSAQFNVPVSTVKNIIERQQKLN